MDVGQFKAWFEGFTEGMEGPPTAKQWERIRAKVKEITHVAATYPAPAVAVLPHHGSGRQRDQCGFGYADSPDDVGLPSGFRGSWPDGSSRPGPLRFLNISSKFSQSTYTW
jgi:hypothetical protein